MLSRYERSNVLPIFFILKINQIFTYSLGRRFSSSANFSIAQNITMRSYFDQLRLSFCVVRALSQPAAVLSNHVVHNRKHCGCTVD